MGLLPAFALAHSTKSQLMKQPEIQMDASTARDLVKQIKRGVNATGEMLLRLKDQNGWSALGYKSWRECALSEFDFSQSRLYELLRTAEVTRQISDASETVAPLTEKQTRALSVVEPEKRKEVFDEAKKRTGLDNPPHQAIEEVINELPPKQDAQDQEPPPRKHKPKSDLLLDQAAIDITNRARLEKWFDEGMKLAAIPALAKQVYLNAKRLAELTAEPSTPSNIHPLKEARG